MKNDQPDGEARIVSDASIMVGKPVVKGIRIPVELVLAHLADNLDLDDLFAAYPELTRDDVKSCLQFAGTVVARHPARRPSRRAGRTPVPQL